MRIERFETAAECERVRAIFPPSATVFSCMPSRQIRAGQPIPWSPANETHPQLIRADGTETELHGRTRWPTCAR